MENRGILPRKRSEMRGWVTPSRRAACLGPALGPDVPVKRQHQGAAKLHVFGFHSIVFDDVPSAF